MTDRERWIVYPLLFFGLGMATFNRIEIDQLVKNVDSKTAEVERLRCKELQVTGKNGNVLVRIDADRDNGSGVIETASATGTPQFVLTSNSNTAVLGMNDRGQLLRIPTAVFRLLSALEKTKPAEGNDDGTAEEK